MFVGKNFLPVDDQSQFEVTVRAPEGSSLGATSQVFERIAAEIRKMPGVTDTLATVGGGQQQVVNAGTIYVKLSADRRHASKSQEHDDGRRPRAALTKVSRRTAHRASSRSRHSRAAVFATRTSSS